MTSRKSSEKLINIGRMISMRRSDMEYPLKGIDLSGTLQQAWEKGWFDEFSNEHFLIKALEKRLNYFPKLYRQPTYNMIYRITPDNFQENFCLNLSRKLNGLINLFGEEKVHKFFTDQLSAGKDNYDEDQFFRALSEISILSYLGMNADYGIYEPETNGRKNPEARMHFKNNVIADVEVKTPGFNSFKGIKNIVIPTVLLTENGRKEFSSFCKLNSLNGAMPRVMKIKDFLNSAAQKFEYVDHTHRMNLLFINWSFSEFEEIGYEEAFSLIAHPINGILVHKDIGMHLGVDEGVYDKITAVVVYTESLYGLMFGDFRWVWARGSEGMPHFGIICMHNCDSIFEITGMNPYAEQPTPIMTGIFQDGSHTAALLKLIGENMLIPSDLLK